MKVKIFSPSIGVIAVADGAGLLYWSEVASRFAVEKFIEFFDLYFKDHPNPSVSDVQLQMKEGILYTNKELINFKHPKTGEATEIMGLGGQTTLGGFVVFELNAKDKKTYGSSWGAFCVGTGDSPSFRFSPRPSGKVDCEWTEMFRDNGQVAL